MSSMLMRASTGPRRADSPRTSAIWLMGPAARYRTFGRISSQSIVRQKNASALTLRSRNRFWQGSSPQAPPRATSSSTASPAREPPPPSPRRWAAGGSPSSPPATPSPRSRSRASRRWSRAPTRAGSRRTQAGRAAAGSACSRWGRRCSPSLAGASGSPSGPQTGPLGEATAAQLGFGYEPEPPFAGRKGRTRLAVVDGLVNPDVARLLVGALAPEEKLVLCGTAIDPDVTQALRELRPGSRARKIPASILAEYRIGLEWR